MIIPTVLGFHPLTTKGSLGRRLETFQAIIRPMPFHILSLLGLGGTIIVILAVLVASLMFRGKQNEGYSLFNHFISELGEVGVSRGAAIFNGGLILGGICLLPYIISLGFLVRSIPGWLGTAAGVLAALGVSAVGIFPMNNLKTHGWAAITFFRAGLVMVFFFALAIQFQPATRLVIPRIANFLSLFAILSYGAFLALLSRPKKGADIKNNLDPAIQPRRPRFWILPFLEWLVFFTTIAWLFGMAFFIL